VCNAAFVAIFGFADVEEAIGSHMADLHPDGDSWDEFLTMVRDKRVLERYECERRRHDGTVVHVVENVVGTFDDRGELIQLKGYVFDDTERRRMQGMVESVARFPSENPFPVLRLSADGTIMYSNPPGRILLDLWQCEVGQRVPREWCALAAQVLQGRRYTLKEVECGSRTLAIAVTPIAEEGYVNLYGQDITQRRQAQQALELSNQTLEQRVRERTEDLAHTVEELKETRGSLLQAQHIARLGNWVYDIGTNELHWSEEVQDLFGLEGDTGVMTYERFLSLIHPEDRTYVEQSISDALRQGDRNSIENSIIREDGQERIVRQRAQIARDQAGDPRRVIGTIQDVTEDKQREERLHRQDVRIREQAELLDLAHDMIIVHDLEGKIIFWNKGAERTYGWKREEVLGRITHDVLRTRFSEPLLKITAALSNRGAWEGELIHRAKDGTLIVVESRWALQKHEDETASAVLEIERDVTERKSAEVQREEARRFAESIIETVQEALIVLDAELQVVSANKAFYRLFGLSPQTTEGRHIFELSDRQWDLPELRRLLDDILPQNTSLEEFEMTYAPPRKSARTLVLNARRIVPQERKRTEMILLAIQDVTLRKRQEQSIRELTEELLLAEEEQRQKVATALHDSIGQMLAFSKRELTALLKRPELHRDGNLKRILGMINESIKQSRELTTDLSTPTLHTFGLEAAIEEMGEQFAQDSGIECHINTTEVDKPLEKKVELLLFRSVKELLCNAEKHANAKHITIDVGKVNGFLELTVTDDGKGFNVERLESARAKKRSFGLFSIEQRLTNVGGSFTIESKRRKGTKIVLQAPLMTTGNQEGN